ELSGGSLFAKDKLVLVRAADRILFPGNAAAAAIDDDAAAAKDGAVKAKDREEAFLACIQKPAGRTWLVLELASLPRNRTLGKRLAELAHVIPCPQPTQRELAPWIAGQARKDGAAIDDDAVEMLLRAHGADIGVLAAELDKLVLFAGAGQRITSAMVGEFLTGTIEFDIFGFTNAIEARNAAEAVFYARRIATQGARDQKGKRESADTSAHKVLAILAGTLENLLRAKMAKARRADAEEFARSAGLSPWRARKLMEASGKFSARELRHMVSFAADQIRSTHDTGGDVMLSLETMAVSFTAAT
ncbi:MAG: DNA polymerase III subunit delta, partial [Planctomycetes bacterium]|nr:DNA polymerase III subunit delta [Planctomycetota bacterium]